MKKLLRIIFIIFLLYASSPIAYAEVSTYHVNKNYDLVPNDIKANKKVILITIDDGPSKYGRGMVTTLLKHKTPAIFFINGMHNKNNLGNIELESKAGFTIGNHTWGHLNLTKISKDLAEKEINNDTKLIAELTGSAPRFFRSPFGMGNTYIKGLVAKDNMIYMNWSGAAKDWEKNTKEEKVFMKNVLSTLHPGEILLIHEHEWTAKYLDNMLSAIESKGYAFVDPKNITQ
jgi:peptidoglycan/xylan/chitin deacetylase (PgdA/CDA1 family)